MNTPLPPATGPDDELRIEFFRKGGLWSTLLPAQSGASQNSVLILTGADGLTDVPSISVGSATYRDVELYDAALKVLELLDADAQTWQAFAMAFARGIEQGELAASILTTGPVPSDGKIPVSSGTTLTASEFAAAAAQIAQAMGSATAGAVTGDGAEQAAAAPTATQQPTATAAPVAPAASPAAGPAAADSPAAAGIVVVPQMPAMPAIPKIAIPQVPTIPPLPDIVLTPMVPDIPALPAGPQSGSPGEAAIAAGSAITLSATLATQTQPGTATADTITMDLVMSADKTQLLSAALHLKNVQCPNTTIGGLDQMYPQPVPLADGKFTIQISELGVIEGALVEPAGAQGVASLALSLPIPGMPAIECDLGRWEWAAAVQ